MSTVAPPSLEHYDDDEGRNVARWAVADRCSGCAEPFTTVFRRHHCRTCLQSYCYRCSRVRDDVDERRRQCDGCLYFAEPIAIVGDGGRVAPLSIAHPPLGGSAAVENAAHQIVALLAHGQFDAAINVAMQLQQLWPHVMEGSVVRTLDRYVASLKATAEAEVLYDSELLAHWAAILSSSISALRSGGTSIGTTVVHTALASAATIGRGVGVLAPSESTGMPTQAIRNIVLSMHREILEHAEQNLYDVLEDLTLARDEAHYDEVKFGYVNEEVEQKRHLLVDLDAVEAKVKALLATLHQSVDGSSEDPRRLPMTLSTSAAAVQKKCQDSDELSCEAMNASMRLEAFVCERQASRDRFQSASGPLEDANPSNDPSGGGVGAATKQSTPVEQQGVHAQQQEGTGEASTQRSMMGVGATHLTKLQRKVRALLPSITTSLRREVFVGWHNQERHAMYRNRLAKLHEADAASGKPPVLTAGAISKVREVQRVCADLNGPNSNAVKDLALTQHADVLLSQQPSLSMYSSVEDVARSAREWISGLPKELVEAAKLTDSLARSDKQGLSSQKTRVSMLGVGGTPVTLCTDDDVKLDGFYLTVEGLLIAMREAGGLHAIVKDSSTQSVIAEGFAFRSDVDNATADAQRQLLGHLTNLCFGDLAAPVLPATGGPTATGGAPLGGGGSSVGASAAHAKSLEWRRVDLVNADANPTVLILPNNTSFGALCCDSTTDWNGVAVETSELRSETPLSRVVAVPGLPMRGTVILTSGAIGVYEAQKREAMALLSRGVNVMCFNYRGYGQSEGEPTETSMLVDIEAAHDYLREIVGIKDNGRIAVKSLCLSGVAGAHLAARKSGVHLLLDQTYSDFGLYLGTEVKRMLRQTALFRMLPSQLSKASEWLVSEVIKRHAPKWSVTKEMKHVTGSVGVMITEEDVNTPKEQALQNIQSLLQGGNTRVRSYVLPGEHATVWLDCVSDGISLADVSIAPFEQSSIVQNVMAKQAPKQWKLLQEQVAAFHASAISDTEFDEACLLAIALTVDHCASSVMHEDSEVCLCRLRNVCRRLLEHRQCHVTFGNFLSSCLARDGASGEDAAAAAKQLLEMSSFRQYPFPGRCAMDDFLRFIGFFSPIHTAPAAGAPSS